MINEERSIKLLEAHRDILKNCNWSEFPLREPAMTRKGQFLDPEKPKKGKNKTSSSLLSNETRAK